MTMLYSPKSDQVGTGHFKVLSFSKIINNCIRKVVLETLISVHYTEVFVLCPHLIEGVRCFTSL